MEQNVSICIPVYNGARWLNACLESACACAVAGEIIICDDGSSDQSVVIGEEFAAKDKRVRVIRNEKNLGLTGNWNRCLDLATKEWIKFLFQDDKLHTGSVEKMIGAAQPSDKLIAAKRNFVFSTSSSEESRIYYTEKVLTLDKVIPGVTEFSAETVAQLAGRFVAMNFIGEPSTVMFRKSVVSEIGNFNTGLKQICDLEYWLRIACRYGMRYVPDAMIDFNVHVDSVSAQNAMRGTSGFDSLLLVDALLHDQKFEPFRVKSSSRSLRRLNLWLRLHAYEAKLNAIHPEDKEKLEMIFAARPQMKALSQKAGNSWLLALLRMRRK